MPTARAAHRRPAPRRRAARRRPRPARRPLPGRGRPCRDRRRRRLAPGAPRERADERRRRLVRGRVPGPPGDPRAAGAVDRDRPAAPPGQPRRERGGRPVPRARRPARRARGQGARRHRRRPRRLLRDPTRLRPRGAVARRAPPPAGDGRTGFAGRPAALDPRALGGPVRRDHRRPARPAPRGPRRPGRGEDGRRPGLVRRPRRRRRRPGRGLPATTSARRSGSARTATGCRGSCSSPRARTSGSTSCRGATGARSGRSTRSRTRSSTRLPGAGSAGCGSSACGSGPPRPSGSSACAATRRPWPRPTRSTTTSSPPTSADPPPSPSSASRAATRGVRLASDMVPNHMGIDSRWVINEPERFLSLARQPVPGLLVRWARPVVRPAGRDLPRGPLLRGDRRRRRLQAGRPLDRVDPRYVYHGNDGTSFPWNDTAQLDYSRAEVREAVIQTILEVARQFPIIRFDAAMVLARKHVQRLWFPEPGHGGAIPSRAGHGLTRAEFDRAMPREFWREVVDRVASRGARNAPAGRGVLAPRGLLRPDARDAPGLQQRVHEHAPRRAQRRLPAGDPEHARVRPGDPRPVRQLHEQPRRADGGRPVRVRRQVLRRGRAHGDPARGCRCSATASSRASPRSTAWSTAGRSATSRSTRACSPTTSGRSSRSSTAGRASPGRTGSACTTSCRTTAR